MSLTDSEATRHCACGTAIYEDHILMVRHIHDGRDYWTLPGGGLEPGETPAEAAGTQRTAS